MERVVTFIILVSVNVVLCGTGIYMVYFAKNKAHEFLGFFLMIGAICIDLLSFIYG